VATATATPNPVPLLTAAPMTAAGTVISASGDSGGARRGHGGGTTATCQPSISIYDLDEGARCCASCGAGYAPLGEQVFELIDWRVVVIRQVHRRRRDRRTCRCPGPRVITAAGPPKAIGKGRFTSGFLARLLVGKYLSARPLHKITTGLARDGLAVPDSTLVGAMRQADHLLVPLEQGVRSCLSSRLARNRAAAKITRKGERSSSRVTQKRSCA